MKPILFLFAALFLVATSQTSRACTCSTNPPPCYAYTKADAVFVGTAKEINRSAEYPLPKIEFEIEKVFKGVYEKSLYTFEFGTSCDFGFGVGQKYLIYANLDEKHKNYFATGYCSRSTTYKENLVDLNFLNSLNNSTFKFQIWGTISNNQGGLVQGIRAQVFDNKKKLVGISDEDGDLMIAVSKEGIYKVRVFPPRGTMMDSNEYVNSIFYREKPKALKNDGSNKAKPFVEYEIEVKSNNCGWFYLPLEKFRKQ